MGFEGCPVCDRDHENHAIWLLSDDPEFNRPYPSVTMEPIEGNVTAWNTPGGRVIQVQPKEGVEVERGYENFEVVTGWDSDQHYGETVEYPTYTTLYKDVETGLLVIDKEAFEKWITR